MGGEAVSMRDILASEAKEPWSVRSLDSPSRRTLHILVRSGLRSPWALHLQRIQRAW